MYRFILNALCRIGLEKLAVRIALRAEPTGPYGSDAWDVIWNQTAYLTCDYCYHPILPNGAHQFCQIELDRIAQEEAEQAIQDEAAWQEYIAEQEAQMALEAEEDRIADEEAEAWRRYEAEQQAQLEDDDNIDDQDDACCHCDSSSCTGDICDHCGQCEGKYGCINGCGEEDPLKGDVEPVGGYPEYTYRVPNGHGGYEEVHYDPNDSRTWPYDPFAYEDDDIDDDEDDRTTLQKS